MASSVVRRSACVAALAALALGGGCGVGEPGEAIGEAAQAKQGPPPPPLAPVICQTHSFPEITWYICLNHTPMKGVWIQSVDIQRKPGDPIVRVLSESGPAEIFVPYHGLPSARLYDMNQWAVLDPILHPADVGANGSVLTFPGDAQPFLGKEVRDRGLAYLCKSSTSKVRRGQELVYCC